MNKRILTCACSAVFSLWFSITTAQVTEQTIKDHVYYLSSKELNGRIAGTDEGRTAAEYIANEFKSAGLSVFSDTSLYDQDFSDKQIIVKSSRLITDTDTTRAVHLNKSIHFMRDAWFTLVPQNSIKALNEQDSFDLIMVEARRFDEGMQTIRQLSQQTDSTKGYLLLFPDKKRSSIKLGLGHLKKADNFSAVYMYNNYLRFSHEKEMTEAYLKEYADLNVFIASQNQIANYTNDLKSVAKVRITEQQDTLIIKGYRNVIAKIEGSKPELPAAVFCAHYDHVSKSYSRTVKNPQTDYFPGADDNASGTAAVIEIAKQLKQNNYQPEQTTYFCLFDAEEVGLVGSRYFAEHLGQEVAFVINMDMIGRNKNDKKKYDDVMFCISKGETGRRFNRDLDKYCRKNADKLKIRRHELSLMTILFSYPSDQLSFRPKSDVSVFYTGDHDDYHTHNDTPDKINYTKLTEYVNMMSSYLMQNGL